MCARSKEFVCECTQVHAHRRGHTRMHAQIPARAHARRHRHTHACTHERSHAQIPAHTHARTLLLPAPRAVRLLVVPPAPSEYVAIFHDDDYYYDGVCCVCVCHTCIIYVVLPSSRMREEHIDQNSSPCVCARPRRDKHAPATLPTHPISGIATLSFFSLSLSHTHTRTQTHTPVTLSAPPPTAS